MRIALFCIMAERTKHKHVKRSFRFLAERHKTLADGTLAKRLVGETTGHRWRNDRSPGRDFAMPPPVSPPNTLAICYSALAVLLMAITLFIFQ